MLCVRHHTRDAQSIQIRYMYVWLALVVRYLFFDAVQTAMRGRTAIDEDDLLGEQSSLRLRLATSTDGLFGPNDGIGGTPRYLSSKSFRIPHHTLLAQSHAADAI